MKQITSVDIIFENCEHITLAAKNVANFYAKNIVKNLYMVNMDEIATYRFVDEFYIRVKDFSELCLPSSFGNKKLFSRRVLHDKDITQIHVHYTDGSNEFSVPWRKNQFFYNSFQRAFIHDGELAISIKKRFFYSVFIDTRGFLNNLKWRTVRLFMKKRK